MDLKKTLTATKTFFRKNILFFRRIDYCLRQVTVAVFFLPLQKCIGTEMMKEGAISDFSSNERNTEKYFDHYSVKTRYMYIDDA